MAGPLFGRGSGTGPLAKPVINRYITVDAFFDPYRATVSQFNTDFRLQQSNHWYVEVGQRYSRKATEYAAVTSGIRCRSTRCIPH